MHSDEWRKQIPPAQRRRVRARLEELDAHLHRSAAKRAAAKQSESERAKQSEEPEDDEATPARP